MKCSPKSHPTTFDRNREPLAGSVVRGVDQPGRSDLSDWVELMEAVEALCPVWPEAISAHGGRYIL